MAKISAAAKESVARRQREETISAVREHTREAVSPDLDRLIHERIRLGIVSALGGKPFADVQRIEGAVENYRRKSERPRAKAGRSELHRVLEIV